MSERVSNFFNSKLLYQITVTYKLVISVCEIERKRCERVNEFSNE